MNRTPIVAMLVAVEILLVGIGVFALNGGHAFSAQRGGGWTAGPIAPIAAGGAPQIEVDDVDSHIDVAISSDGLVHVADRSRADMLWGGRSIAPLHVSRTAGGVSISRAHSDSFSTHMQFGFSDRRIEVDVPPGAHLKIVRCSGATLTGVQGGAEVHSQDGRITMTNVRGDALAAQSDDGSIHLDGVTAASLDAHSSDGSIVAKGLTLTGSAPHASLQTDDGSIEAGGSFPANGSYDVSTRDGSIRLAVQRDADLTVDASTSNGSISVDGTRSSSGDGDGAHHTVRLGNGSGNLRASSDDGSIHILTNGAV
jgi:DUF4097 and DUF4098 domain-containing protein YvlB